MITRDIKDIFENFKLKFEDKTYIHNPNTKRCYIVFPVSPEFLTHINIDCGFYFSKDHFELDFEQTLNFLNIFYDYFQQLYPEIGIISENEYNTLSLFLATHHADISLLILRGELFPSNFPKVYNYIQPRICIDYQNTCNDYKIIKYIHRLEMYENIHIPIIWIVSRDDILKEDSKQIKKSMEIFHNFGTKQFTQKWIIYENEKDLIKLKNLL